MGMKKLLLLLLFIPLLSFSQKSNDADALKLCVALQSNNFTTDAEAEDAVNKILSVIGASQKPVLQACSNINNAVAAVYKGQRYILYDREFMNSLTAGSNKYWSNMFILAHEIGHHINGHSLDIILYANDVIDPKSLEERRKQELEADEFAGFVLAKLGASLSQTSKVLSNLPSISNENSSTHPTKDKRITSVRIGFNKGEVKKEIVYKESSKKNELNLNQTVNSNWTYNFVTKKNTFFPPLFKEQVENREIEIGRKLDPFELKEVRNIYPLLIKETFAIGKSFRNDDKVEEIKLKIKQTKYFNKNGKVGDGWSSKNEYETKHLPYKEIEISILGFKEQPKFHSSNLFNYDYITPIDTTEFKTTNEYMYEYRGKLFSPKETKLAAKKNKSNNIESFLKEYDIIKMDSQIVKFHYIIDDNTEGFLVGKLAGWEPERFKREDGYYQTKSKNENGFVNAVPSEIYLNSQWSEWYNSINDERGILEIIKFIKALKNGKKLYLRIGNKYIPRNTEKNQFLNFSNEDNWENFDFDQHTYIFDLTGSSKALQF